MKKQYYPVLLEALRKGDIERRTEIDGSRVELLEDGKIIYRETEEPLVQYRTEFIKTEPHIVIFGAGHVSKALYEMARIISAEVTVIDEREEMACRSRFPEAEIIVMNYEEFFTRDRDFFRPYYVIMTHGHEYDSRALEYVLKKPHSYIGMIGSRGKVSATMKKMAEKGYPESLLDSVHAPVGISIGAVTPEEIAVSITAEIISVFRNVKTAFTISPEYIRSVSGKNGVSARIVEKHGSAPRSVGSELFYSADDNSFFGTVGGGAVEKAAEEECRRIWKDRTPYTTVHYNLSSDGDLAMICGGDVDILFSRVE